MRRYRKTVLSFLGFSSIPLWKFAVNVFDAPGRFGDLQFWIKLFMSESMSIYSWFPALACLGFAIYFWRQERVVAIPTFDMSFQDALNHCIRNSRYVAFTEDSRPSAERLMAQDLVALARKGRLRIAGVKGRGEITRIKPRTIKNLTPHDTAIPSGHTWILGPVEPKYAESSTDDKETYFGILVDSRDVYKLYKKTSPTAEAERDEDSE